MKKIYHKSFYILLTLSTAGLLSCNKALDLKPQDQLSEAAYFKSANDFKTFANQYYGYLRNFGNSLGDNPHYDGRADVFGGGGAFGAGNNTVPASDGSWNNNYSRIRNCNYLLEKAAAYPDQAGIAQFVAEARFFRAYCYFDLLQLFGGVPLITKTLGLESPELYAARASRDAVADQIVADLEAAIPNLPASLLVTARQRRHF
jgi:hypothetical protein